MQKAKLRRTSRIKVAFMKKIATLLTLCVVMAGPVSALLPPLYQDIKEITTLLTDEAIQNVLESGDRIIEIRRIERGYQIVTNRHTVDAEIIRVPNEAPGPSKFRVVFKNVSVN
jgi:hypothetical protein